MGRVGGGGGENGYLFSGSWGALVSIFKIKNLGSKLIVSGIKGALQKQKKSN